MVKITDEQKEVFEKLLTKKIDTFFSENNWNANNYASNQLKERKDLGQFFTPSVLCAKMLAKLSKVKEAYLDEEGNIKEENPKITDEPLFDPTAGCGNLLAAGIAIGWDPEWIYANELDPKIYEVLVEGLSKLSVPKDHIRCGDIFEMTKVYFDLMDNQQKIKNFSVKEKVDLAMNLTKEEYDSVEFRNLPYSLRLRYSIDGTLKKEYNKYKGLPGYLKKEC